MFSRSIASVAGRRAASKMSPALSRGFMSSTEDYGSHCFKGAVADEYLAKQGLPAGVLDDSTWTTKNPNEVSYLSLSLSLPPSLHLSLSLSPSLPTISLLPVSLSLSLSFLVEVDGGGRPGP